MIGKVICYYHRDMDGIGAASIVKSLYPNATFLSVNYGDTWDKSSVEGALVIVVDFSFDNMKELNETCRLLYWIDHHQTAKTNNLELWNSENIGGLRDIRKSGCELTWDLFNPELPTPLGIKLIGDRDMWKFEYGRDTKAFNEYASMVCKEPDTRLLSKDDEITNLWVKPGHLLLQMKEKQVIQSYSEGTDIVFEGHSTRLLNTNHNISDVGEYAYKNNEYPIALIWSFRDRKIICSLRSNKNSNDPIDVGKIAEKYDGGGHKFASGFTMTVDKFREQILGKVLLK